MADNGFVRTYQKKGKRRKKRRSRKNNASNIILAILVIIAISLSLVLIFKIADKEDTNDDKSTTSSSSQNVGSTSNENSGNTDNNDNNNNNDNEENTTNENGETTTSNNEENTSQPDATEPNEDTSNVTEPTQVQTTVSGSASTDEPFIITGEIVDNALKIEVNEDNWELALVNKFYTLGGKFSPSAGLVKLPASDGASGGNCKMNAFAADWYQKMYDQCLEDTDIQLNVVSAYRSYDYQDGLYQKQVQREIDRGYEEEAAKIKAATVVARPGMSEHNLGLAVDIGRINENFETAKGFEWLMAHGHEYGFVLRYPKDKQDITHVIYEPWHWRYVGIEHATYMKEHDLVLEEYLGLVEVPEQIKDFH